MSRPPNGVLVRRFAFALFLAIVTTPLNAQLQNVDDLVQTTVSGLRLNRATNTFDAVATIRNISALPITGPIQLVVTQISPPSITLANAAGLTANGLPYVDVPAPGNALLVGGLVQVALKFNNPSRIAFTFANSLLGMPGGGQLPAPKIVILTPQPFDLFSSGPVQVTGTVVDPAAAITINGQPVGNNAGSFTALVLISVGNTTITVVATKPGAGAGVMTVVVILDEQAPTVTIDIPIDGFQTTAPLISLGGVINDIVVGTVNGNQATVTVNGSAAIVSNRTWSLPDFPLLPGPNLITAVALDQVGNQGSRSITVNRVTAPEGKSTLGLLDGNNQSNGIGQMLAEPLKVLVRNGAGAPEAGKQVIFRVAGSNGSLSNSPGGMMTLVTESDANGVAQAHWTLGTRAGASNNIVEATAVGVFGKAIFTANALTGTPTKINVDANGMQMGAVELPLPRPFIAAVTDAGHNRLHGVPVTFTVTAGGGVFANGQQSVLMNTDSDGRVLATLTLGPDEGVDNNRVEANFTGNPAFPAVFSASGKFTGDPAATRISGVVLDNSNVPIEGVTIHIRDTTLTTTTSAQGQFLIQSAPVGRVLLEVDGTTANRPGTWPHLEFELITVPGQNNTVGMPIFLLPLSTNQVCVSQTEGGTLTMAEVPGFALEIAPGSVTFPNNSKTGCVSVTLVHSDKVPMTPNFGQQPRFIVTIQPAGAHFDPPAPISIPNVDGMAPGSQTEMYSFDHDLGSFVAIGTGTVSVDGLVIKSDPGVGVLKAGWHCGGDPATAGTVADCPECQWCATTSCVPDPAQEAMQCEGDECKICVGGSCDQKTLEITGMSPPVGILCPGCMKTYMTESNPPGETVTWSLTDGTGAASVSQGGVLSVGAAASRGTVTVKGELPNQCAEVTDSVQVFVPPMNTPRNALGLTPGETSFCASNPICCLQNIDIQDEAFDALNNSGIPAQFAQDPNEGNAFLHFWSNCTFARRCSVGQAEEFWNAHEEWDGNSCQNSSMDFHNNVEGRQQSSQAGTCSDLALGALSAGSLRYMTQQYSAGQCPQFMSSPRF